MDYYYYHYYWITVFSALLTIVFTGCSAITVDIHWNTTNKLFKDGDHFIELALQDQIKLHCPIYDAATDLPKEYYIIYKVPQEYYNSCSLPAAVAYRKLRKYGIERVVICQTPFRINRFSAILQSFNALPGSHGGLVFEPGETYYFISTSNGTLEGLYNRERSQSSCLNSNMRLKLKVLRANARPAVTQIRRTTPHAISHSYNSTTATSTSEPHVRRHNNEGRPPKPVTFISDHTTVNVPTTPEIKRFDSQHAIAIINAEVTLKPSAYNGCDSKQYIFTAIVSSVHVLLVLCCMNR